MDSFDITEHVTLLTRLACGHKTCQAVHISQLKRKLFLAVKVQSSVCGSTSYTLKLRIMYLDGSIMKCSNNL